MRRKGSRKKLRGKQKPVILRKSKLNRAGKKSQDQVSGRIVPHRNNRNYLPGVWMLRREKPLAAIIPRECLVKLLGNARLYATAKSQECGGTKFSDSTHPDKERRGARTSRRGRKSFYKRHGKENAKRELPTLGGSCKEEKRTQQMKANRWQACGAFFGGNPGAQAFLKGG